MGPENRLIWYLLTVPARPRRSVTNGFGTVLFTGLDLSSNQAGYYFSAGCFSVCLATPFLGTWSDACSHHWGRRRIFIVWGLALSTLAFLTLPNCQDIGSLLGDTSGSRPWGVTIAIFCWLVSWLEPLGDLQ
jgi:MFS family permease